MQAEHPTELLTPVEPTATPQLAPVVAQPAAVKRRRKRRPIGVMVAATYVGVLSILATCAPLLPLPEYDVKVGPIAARPFGDFLLGTDQLGRDLLSRVLWAGRVSLFICIVSTGIALAIGLTFGLIAGHFRGRIDAVISAVVDVTLAFPTLVLLMAIISVRGTSTTNLVVGLVIILSTGFIRLSRAATIANSQREYVSAARGLGASIPRILSRELLPNVLPSISAYAFTAAAHVFLIEGSLSFLGLGVPPPTPTWGSMIEGGRLMFSDAPHIVLVPAVTMALTVIAFNALGDHFRRGKGSREDVTL